MRDSEIRKVLERHWYYAGKDEAISNGMYDEDAVLGSLSRENDSEAGRTSRPGESGTHRPSRWRSLGSAAPETSGSPKPHHLRGGGHLADDQHPGPSGWQDRSRGDLFHQTVSRSRVAFSVGGPGTG
jgi:hypothetical protein